MTRWRSCRHCGQMFPADLLTAHLAADHGDLTPVDLDRLPQIVDLSSDVDPWEQAARQTAYEQSIYGD